MKTKVATFLCVFCLAGFSTACANGILSQLSDVNKEWPKQKDGTQFISGIDTSYARSYNDWIKLHLSLVEKTLRSRNSDQLSPSQIKNRIQCLDNLHAYWLAGRFPVNDYLPYKTPVFIDRKDIHCAVGYLMMSSGHDDLAQKINEEQKFAYVAQIKVAGVNEWANENGFTLDELAWIQPMYPCQYPGCPVGQVKNPSCYLGYDGCIGGPNTFPGIPPYIISFYTGHYVDTSLDYIGQPCDLGAGDYTLLITDGNGIHYPFYYTLTQPDSYSVISSVLPDCYGQTNGTISISVTGATPPSYLWNNFSTDTILTGRYPGNDTVTITDSNGCTKLLAFTIPQNDSFATTSSIVIPCNGQSSGSIALNVSGATPPYTYLWSDSATSRNLSNVTAGTYSVTITDSINCIRLLSVLIPDDSISLAIATFDDNGYCNGSAFIFANGGIGQYSYSWSAGVQNDSIVTRLCHGNYSVTVSDANGCAQTCTFSIGLTTGIQSTGNELSISLVPNPAGEFTEIKSGCGNIDNVKVIDQAGKEMPVKRTENRIDVSMLEPGVYVFQIFIENTVFERPFMKL